MIGHDHGQFHSWARRDTLLRAMIAVIMCLLPILSTASSTCSVTLAQDGTLFARPINGWDNVKGLFLLGSFKAGLKVILISEKGLCTATTGAVLQFKLMDDLMDATHLVGIAKCPKNPTIAILGIGPERVRLRLPKETRLSLPESVKSLFQKSTRWTEWLARDPENPYSLETLHPRAFRVGRFTLLKFRWKGPGEQGPSLLLFDDHVFELEVNCTDSHVFFLVDRKLYLTYTEGGCFSGLNIVFVYDLSGASPKCIYCGDLST